MTLRSEFFEDLDRFAVFRSGSTVGLDDLTRSPAYTSLEYLRYVPVGDVSLDEANAHLARSPRELCCEVTTACSLVCCVCIASAPSLTPKHLPVDALHELLSELPSDVARVTITGGEPTLHPDLAALVECCSEAGKLAVISTNGYDSKGALRALASADRVLLAVSLHGPRAVHDRFVGRSGSYERARDTIASAIAAGHRTHVLTTATSDTLPSLEALTLSLSDLRVAEHRINLVRPNGRATVGAASYEQVCRAIEGLQVPHKFSVKRADQPQLFLTPSGELEARREREY